jgi:hypothetical protein
MAASGMTEIAIPLPGPERDLDFRLRLLTQRVGVHPLTIILPTTEIRRH